MVVKRLIPSDASISRQFEIRNQLVLKIERWAGHKINSVWPKIDVASLEKASGIRCHYVGDNLAGFNLVDEQAYLLFILRN